MPAQKPVHWNPRDDQFPKLVGKTRCGRYLSKVKWSADLQDATCNSCARYGTKGGLLEVHKFEYKESTDADTHPES